MLREIKKDGVIARLTDPSVFVMKLSQQPSGKKRATYEFVPLIDFGTPSQIIKALEGDNIRVMEEVANE